jgi:membrane fusion protein (multidrug efflux system)
VGQQVGNDWLINGGLEPNDRVVTEGLQSAKEGTLVDPQPYKAGATNNAAPVTKP